MGARTSWGTQQTVELPVKADKDEVNAYKDEPRFPYPWRPSHKAISATVLGITQRNQVVMMCTITEYY